MNDFTSQSAMRRLFAGTSLLAIGAMLPAAAQAQADPAAATGAPITQRDARPAANPTDADAGMLADIIVTAQRRAESAQRAAVPLSTISPAALGRAGVVSSTTLNAAVPALVVQKAGGANTIFYIRGVGNFTVNAYADPAVAINLDGVYLGRPTSTTGAFFDLDRVEVLKGPQGTLYGRNATGGAVNVIPAKPRYGQLSGYINGGYGSYNSADGEAAINVPVGSRAAFRLSGRVVNYDGYYKDGTNDEVGQAIRGQFMADLSPALTVRVAADYSHQGGVGPGFSFAGAYRYAPGAAATATSVANYAYAPATLDRYEGLQTAAARAYAATLTIPGAFIRPGASLFPYNNNKYWGVLAEISLKTGFGTLTVLPAHRDSRLDNVFNGPNFAGGITKEHDRQDTVEARFQGERVGPVDWLIGGYYFDEDINGRYTFGQYQINSYQAFTTGTTSYAGFGRLTWNVNDAIRLVGGLRYTRDRKTINSNVQTLVEICSNAPPPAGPGCFANNSGSVPAVPTLADLPGRPLLPGPANSVAFGTAGNRLFYSPFVLATSRSFGRITYRAAAEYDIAPRSLLYASVETGFRGGGFSNTVGYEAFDPEFLTAYMLGSKNRFLANRLQLNVELFYWKYRNQQVSHFGPDANGANSLFTENIGRSTIKGVDVDTQFLIARTTLLRGNVQYLDNKLVNFSYSAAFGGTNLPPLTGCPVTTGTRAGRAVYIVNCSGLPGFNSPRWSVNLGADQTIELGDYKVVLSVDGRYRGNRVTGFERVPQMMSGSDTTIDLVVSFAPKADRWFINGFVRNATNESAVISTQYASPTGGSISSIYSQPRTVGVRGGVKF